MVNESILLKIENILAVFGGKKSHGGYDNSIMYWAIWVSVTGKKTYVYERSRGRYEVWYS